MTLLTDQMSINIAGQTHIYGLDPGNFIFVNNNAGQLTLYWKNVSGKEGVLDYMQAQLQKAGVAFNLLERDSFVVGAFNRAYRNSRVDALIEIPVPEESANENDLSAFLSKIMFPGRGPNKPEEIAFILST